MKKKRWLEILLLSAAVPVPGHAAVDCRSTDPRYNGIEFRAADQNADPMAAPIESEDSLIFMLPDGAQARVPLFDVADSFDCSGIAASPRLPGLLRELWQQHRSELARAETTADELRAAGFKALSAASCFLTLRRERAPFRIDVTLNVCSVQAPVAQVVKLRRSSCKECVNVHDGYEAWNSWFTGLDNLKKATGGYSDFNPR